MLALARSLIFILGLLLFISGDAALAQNWNQGGYQQVPQTQYQFNNQNQFSSQNQYGNQMQGQLQNQMQSQGAYQGAPAGQYGNPMQMQNTYYGQAQQSQGYTNQNNMPYSTGNTTTGGFTGGQSTGSFGDQSTQSSAPGTFIDYGNQSTLSGSSSTNDSAPRQSGGGKLKGATGAIGSILGKSLKAAAPVAGAYMVNKAAQRNGGYYQPNPYAYGAYGNPYGTPYGTPYGAPNPYYGGYGYSNPYGTANPYYGNPYTTQQSMGNSILNTGLRALFGY